MIPLRVNFLTFSTKSKHCHRGLYPSHFNIVRHFAYARLASICNIRCTGILLALITSIWKKAKVPLLVGCCSEKLVLNPYKFAGLQQMHSHSGMEVVMDSSCRQEIPVTITTTSSLVTPLLHGPKLEAGFS